MAITFADRVPGSLPPKDRIGQIEPSPAAVPAIDIRVGTSAVGPGFFEAFERPIPASRALRVNPIDALRDI